MGLTKFGTGQVLPEPNEPQHTATKDEDLDRQLAEENAEADGADS